MGEGGGPVPTREAESDLSQTESSSDDAYSSKSSRPVPRRKRGKNLAREHCDSKE